MDEDRAKQIVENLSGPPCRCGLSRLAPCLEPHAPPVLIHTETHLCKAHHRYAPAARRPEARPQQEERCAADGQTREHYYHAGGMNQDGTRWSGSCPFVPPLPVEPASTVETTDEWHRKLADVFEAISDGRIKRPGDTWLPMAAAAVEEIRRAEPVDPTPVEPPQEEKCERCGGPNPIAWHAPSPLWNAVMRRSPSQELYNFCCPTCFVIVAKEAGIEGVWHLEVDGRDFHGEPFSDGRVWDATKCQWVAATVPESPSPLCTVCDEPVDEHPSPSDHERYGHRPSHAPQEGQRAAERTMLEVFAAPVEDEESGWNQLRDFMQHDSQCAVLKVLARRGPCDCGLESGVKAVEQAIEQRASERVEGAWRTARVPAYEKRINSAEALAESEARLRDRALRGMERAEASLERMKAALRFADEWMERNRRGLAGYSPVAHEAVRAAITDASTPEVAE